MILHDAEHGPPSEATIYEEVERFGWKVHPTKRFTWTRRFTLLGFVWDLDAGTVALTEEKRDKYLRKLTAFLQPTHVTYREVSSVLGTLVHTCAVFVERRAQLNALYALRARFVRACAWHSLALPTAARVEVKAWMSFLQQPSLARTFHIPSASFAHIVYSDASNLGCAVVLDGRAQFWPLPDVIDGEGIDIGVMEAWGLSLALQASVAYGAKECVVRFAVDNLGVVYAVRKGRSRSRWTNRCLAAIAEMATEHAITMSVSYIASADNPADAPSRGDCSQFASLDFNWAAPWQESQGAALSQ
ncbi:hypothetical protein CF335_g9453 [Tilletia laevis]|nr:hypothetical protein CF335_g9453 [Tilletia laevis]